jgi:hypothetical protein
MTTLFAMRSRSAVQSVILYNNRDAKNEWIPTKVEVNSWIVLMPGKVRGHAKDSKKHGGDSMDGCYKAKVLQFQLNDGSNVVLAVRVQHAYQ